MTKPQVIVDVKPRGIASAYIVAPFDEGKESLAKEGYKIISLQENARLRIQESKEADVSKNGNWVREGAIYVPGKGKFLTKLSPIMTNAKQATDRHRQGHDFYLTDAQVEQSLADSVELSVKSIPTNRFADCDITAYAFGEEAKKYGEFLKEVGIEEMPIWTADLQDKPFVRQVWFDGLDYWSELDCSGRYLSNVSGVRGVCESAEGTAKNFEAYTPAQIEKTLKQLGFSGVTKSLVDRLRN